MKVIKNIIFVAIVFLISIVLLVVGNGYDMYKDAISKIPLTEKEVLRISRDYFENKGYKVYFTNAEFEYQNAKRKVEINEYMIAFKEWEESKMNQYTYFALGIVLGISLAVYYFMNREEKIESRIKLDQKIYSTKLLDITMESVVKKINEKIKEVKRELTEDEKNEIIKECYKEQF
mgnify:CR=1 FL=1